MKKLNIKKLAIIIVILMAIAAICIFGYIVYKNIFAGVESKRLEGIETHKLASSEKKDIEDHFKELEGVKSVNVEVNKNSKIIKVKVILKEDVNLDTMKKHCDSTIEKVSEKNLEFYDLEIFIDTENESEVYPQIGYKHRTKETFSW